MVTNDGFAFFFLRIHMSLIRLQLQKKVGLVHPYTNNWVERSKAIKRLRLRLQPVVDSNARQQRNAETDASASDHKNPSANPQSGGGGIGATAPAAACAGDPYLKLEISKEDIDAISDFSKLL